MTIRQTLLTFVTIVLIGVAIAFLWVQVGLPTIAANSPWDSPIHVFPSIYALWIPLIYLFFSGIWMYVFRKQPGEEVRFFLKLDYYSYVAVLLFFLLQLVWREFDLPALWFRGFVLMLLLLKSFFLFRMLYRSPQFIQPVLLVGLGVGLHMLLSFFVYRNLSLSITEFLHREELFQLVIKTVKSLGLSLMTLEMFRLGNEMTKSVRSAFFSWLIVTFTFPVIGFPRTSYIFVGLLIIFILRMVFSRLDVRELMLGLLTPTNIMILLKLLIILVLLLAAGLVFWSNVRPGFGFRSDRAWQAAIGTLFDGQQGVLCYAPVYWLAFFGIMYLLFFKVWDGVLLIIMAGILHIGYHFAVYGILGKVAEQSDSVPLIPILGVFIAVAHNRFGKMVLFRCGVRLAVIATFGITSILILLYPDIPSVMIKIPEIQRTVMTAFGRDIMYIAPSMIFRIFPVSFFLWTGVIIVFALFFCNRRTRSVSLFVRKITSILAQYVHFREFTFSPCLVFIFLLGGSLIIRYADETLLLPIDEPIHLSRFQEQQEIFINEPLPSKGICIVSNMTASMTVPHKTPVANVIILGQNQRFESFTMKIGKDTSEEALEKPEIKHAIAHGRSAVYRSWNVEAGDGRSFAAHDYYTKFLFSRPLNVQKITLKFLNAESEKISSVVALHIKEIDLIQ
jgi:hypothetical protein